MAMAEWLQKDFAEKQRMERVLMTQVRRELLKCDKGKKLILLWDYLMISGCKGLYVPLVRG